MTFYTYMWLREDGTPYYVGKGNGKRAYQPHKGFRPPADQSRILIQFWESEEKASQMEKWWIAFYGRKDNGTGILRNLTDGGEGFSGLVRTPEHSAKLAKANRGKKQKATAIEKRARALRGRIQSESERAKRSKTRMGMKFSSTHIANLRTAHLGQTFGASAKWSKAGERDRASLLAKKQMAAEPLEVRKARARLGGFATCHLRWHAKRGIVKEGCELCR